MTDKAYIVANEQQEREVLENLGHEELVWIDDEKFPHVIFENSCVYRDKLEYLQDEEIVFDGRKEERMSDKYVVSQEFMDELKRWKDTLSTYDEPGCFIEDETIKLFPYVVTTWWVDNRVPDKENNNRLIAILRWVNGEDIFEVEKPKKWVVRSKDLNWNGAYYYGVLAKHSSVYQLGTITGDFGRATRFDTKEEAQEWANSHQEVVEVEE